MVVGRGFDLYASEIVLRFAGTRYAGAEVVCRGDVSIAVYRGLRDAPDMEAEWAWFRAHVLSSWNLEADGKPLSIETAFDALPGQFVAHVIRSWVEAVGSVTVPLSPPSSDGATSAAA